MISTHTHAHIHQLVYIHKQLAMALAKVNPDNLMVTLRPLTVCRFGLANKYKNLCDKLTDMQGFCL